MPADTTDPTTAVTYGPFIQAAEAQYSSDPSQLNPATITTRNRQWNGAMTFTGIWCRSRRLLTAGTSLRVFTTSTRASTVSWRIYNQVDVVPYFPMDISHRYQPVTTGYAINSLGQAKWSLSCAHSLNTYMHMLSPATVPLDQACI